ncbi:hypothetical protein STEG23_003140, partial [Scotinomys teguina]
VRTWCGQNKGDDTVSSPALGFTLEALGQFAYDREHLGISKAVESGTWIEDVSPQPYVYSYEQTSISFWGCWEKQILNAPPLPYVLCPYSWTYSFLYALTYELTIANKPVKPRQIQVNVILIE